MHLQQRAGPPAFQKHHGGCCCCCSGTCRTAGGYGCCHVGGVPARRAVHADSSIGAAAGAASRHAPQHAAATAAAAAFAVAQVGQVNWQPAAARRSMLHAYTFPHGAAAGAAAPAGWRSCSGAAAGLRCGLCAASTEPCALRLAACTSGGDAGSAPPVRLACSWRAWRLGRRPCRAACAATRGRPAPACAIIPAAAVPPAG